MRGSRRGNGEAVCYNDDASLMVKAKRAKERRPPLPSGGLSLTNFLQKWITHTLTLLSVPSIGCHLLAVEHGESELGSIVMERAGAVK